MSTVRRVVHVTGTDPAGTGTLAGVLRAFGLRVPGPETSAHGPQWVGDLHEGLLRAADVRTSDPRPLAWHLVDRAAVEANAAGRMRAWLETQTAQHGDLVITDPRLLWFLETWLEAATRAGVRASCLTLLRPPAEAVAAAAADAAGRDLVDHVAGWVNLMLGTELATRTTPRAFVRHADLLHDWDEPVFAAAAALDLPMVHPGDLAAVHRVDALIDPTRRPATTTWDDVPVPGPLRTLADDTWAALDALPEHDDAGTRAEFDRLRALYPYVHRKVTASPARRFARMMPPEVPHTVRRGVAGMLRRSPDPTG
ncbi:hypothetical protein ACFQHV_16020 [Promicromonospora thailandica]|uniref:Sulfotransferase family protein n=1 Tax=Promicromonospora thailandica TaxID=765201 RepID=A0A9X2JUN0_9MICO|nr:hypothetical protein [Promicromonospora thailandica]MCP2264675.1 hypothetical protein [Promicromonospora thailandica]BFF20248.1 hypothetical protein GCM10025730_37690 [Promicromonospora thailandica]